MCASRCPRCSPPPKDATPKRSSLKRHHGPVELAALPVSIIDEEASLEPPDSCSTSRSDESLSRPLKAKRATWSGSTREDLEVVHTVYDTHYRRTCWKRHRSAITCLAVCLLLSAIIVIVCLLLVRMSQHQTFRRRLDSLRSLR
jgi:hypothetical protein